ncbi:hypothetical protein CW700_05770 [Candidatus Bathyarchaeota archaeon]|nr:MAG: hypothetical protein CW700_05770 [Candidatus Bathyarchaeota archaeon]
MKTMYHIFREFETKPECGEWHLNLLEEKDTSLVGAIGELIAWKYLSKIGFSIYRFGSVYFPGIHKGQVGLSDFLSENLIWLDEKQVDYLKNIYKYEARAWDFIGCRRQYRSRYGRRKIEQTSSELREAHSKKEEKEIKAKKEALEKLLKKFLIVDFYLIEIKTRSESSHDLRSLKWKMQTNIPYAKSLGFKPLLIIVTLLDNWRAKVACKEL